MKKMKQYHDTYVKLGYTPRIQAQNSTQKDRSMPQEAGLSMDYHRVYASPAAKSRPDTAAPRADSERIRTAAWRAGRQWRFPGSSRT